MKHLLSMLISLSIFVLVASNAFSLSSDVPLVAVQSAGNVYGTAKVFMCGNASCQTPAIKEFGSTSELGGPPFGTADGFNEIRYGFDGLPFLVHDHYTAATGKYDLRLVKCNDANCATYSQNYSPSTHPIANYPFGGSFAVEIGSDHFPVIAWVEKSSSSANTMIAVLHCLNTSCSQQDAMHQLSVVYMGDEFGTFGMDLQIGSDGYPLITAVSRQVGTFNDQLFFAKCNDVACASYTTRILDSNPAGSLGTGYSSSITINRAGNPVITYTDALPTPSSAKIKLLTCRQKDCSGAVAISSLSLGAPAFHSEVVIRSDGLPALSTTLLGQGIRFIDCADVDCAQFTMQSIAGTGGYPYPVSALKLNASGLPVIASIGDTTPSNSPVWLTTCLTVSCSQATVQNIGSVQTIASYQPVHPFGGEISLDFQ